MEENSGTSNMEDSAVGSKQLTFTLKKVRFLIRSLLNHNKRQHSSGLPSAPLLVAR